MALALESLLWAPEALTAKLEAVFPAAVEATGKRIQAAAPRRSGKMADGINSKIAAPGVGVVYIPGPGYFVIKGTKPHDITPRKGSVLAFFWDKAGGDMFFTVVHHPGTRANPFQAPAVAEFPLLYNEMATGAVMSSVSGLF